MSKRKKSAFSFRTEPEKKAETKPKKKRFMGFGKILCLMVIAIAVEVILYTEAYMWHFTATGQATGYTLDVSPLYILVSTVVGAVIGAVVSYAFKSKAENTEGGIVYETMLAEMQAAQNAPGVEETEDAGESADGGCG